MPTLVTKRVGPSGTSFSEKLFDCSTGTFEYLGDGDTREEMRRSDSWPEMIEHSRGLDLSLPLAVRLQDLSFVSEASAACDRICHSRLRSSTRHPAGPGRRRCESPVFAAPILVGAV